jgi:hypothetical protein
VVNFMPRPLYPRGSNSRYPLVRKLCEPQSRCGRGCKEKNPSPCLESKPGCPAHSLVTILTELPRLLDSCPWCYFVTEWRMESSHKLFSILNFFIKTYFFHPLDDRDSIPGKDRGFFFPPPRLDRFWGPRSLPCDGCTRGSFPGGQRG